MRKNPRIHIPINTFFSFYKKEGEKVSHWTIDVGNAKVVSINSGRVGCNEEGSFRCCKTWKEANYYASRSINAIKNQYTYKSKFHRIVTNIYLTDKFYLLSKKEQYFWLSGYDNWIYKSFPYWGNGKAVSVRAARGIGDRRYLIDVVDVLQATRMITSFFSHSESVICKTKLL